MHFDCTSEYHVKGSSDAPRKRRCNKIFIKVITSYGEEASLIKRISRARGDVCIHIHRYGTSQTVIHDLYLTLIVYELFSIASS